MPLDGKAIAAHIQAIERQAEQQASHAGLPYLCLECGCRFDVRPKRPPVAETYCSRCSADGKYLHTWPRIVWASSEPEPQSFIHEVKT